MYCGLSFSALIRMSPSLSNVGMMSSIISCHHPIPNVVCALPRTLQAVQTFHEPAYLSVPILESAVLSLPPNDSVEFVETEEALHESEYPSALTLVPLPGSL